MFFHGITVHSLAKEHMVVSCLLRRNLILCSLHLVLLVEGHHRILEAHLIFGVKKLRKMSEILLNIGIKRSVGLKGRVEHLMVAGKKAILILIVILNLIEKIRT